MKSKQPTSKREFRDGGSSKKPAAKKPAAPKAAAPKAAAPKTQNKRSDGLKAGKSSQTGFKPKAQAADKQHEAAPKTRATRAKKPTHHGHEAHRNPHRSKSHGRC